jgi:acyl-coenzyme A synthetase/AMP-(fatty) acid ligase
MPEENELKTLVEEFEENLKEQRQEQKEESSFLKMASLSTAIIAVIAALASLEAGSTVNEALSKKNDVAVAISKASDQWAFYQAKGIKATVLESQRSVLTSLGKPIPGSANHKISIATKKSRMISSKRQKNMKKNPSS